MAKENQGRDVPDQSNRASNDQPASARPTVKEVIERIRARAKVSSIDSATEVRKVRHFGRL